MDKGKQIDIGEVKSYSVIKVTYMIYGIFALILPVIAVLWIYSILPEYIIMVTLAMSVSECAGVWIITTVLRLRPLKIYENGFMPRIVPYSFWFKHKEFFVPWKDVVKIDSQYYTFRGEEAWVFIMSKKNNKKSFTISFKDCAADKRSELLKMLKDLEKKIDSRK